jgi:uncharacterized protein
MIRRYMTEAVEWQRYQFLVYVFGVVLFAVGARIFIDAGLGADPLDVLVVGMDSHLHIGLGLCSSIVAVLFLLWWMVWNRKLPPLTPFVTTSAVGFLLDTFGAIEMRRYTVDLMPHLPFAIGEAQYDFGRFMAVIGGLIVCSYASALIIMSGIGIRIMDMVAITMVERLGWSFFRAKMTLEIGLFTAGWMLGGPLGITTLLFLVFVGPFIQPFMWMSQAYLGIPNKGLRPPKPAQVASV